VFQPTFDADPASLLFNLPDYRVVCVTAAVGDDPRQVVVETIDTEGACPACGVLSSRVQARPVQEVKDVTCGGERLAVSVRKRRYVCAETACPRRTFTEQTGVMLLLRVKPLGRGSFRRRRARLCSGWRVRRWGVSRVRVRRFWRAIRPGVVRRR
jgi:hypothetical protein